MSAHLIRLTVVLWALAVAAMPGTLAIADARLEAKSLAGVPSHVEALGGTGCAPVHDAECAVCSSLRLLTGPTARGAAPGATAGRMGTMPCPGRTHVASSDTWPDRQPRAPPTV